MINPKDTGSLATTEKRQSVRQWPQLTSSWFLLDDVRRSRKSHRGRGSGGKHPERVRERKTETEERVTGERQERKGTKKEKERRDESE